MSSIKSPTFLGFPVLSSSLRLGQVDSRTNEFDSGLQHKHVTVTGTHRYNLLLHCLTPTTHRLFCSLRFTLHNNPLGPSYWSAPAVANGPSPQLTTAGFAQVHTFCTCSDRIRSTSQYVYSFIVSNIPNMPLLLSSSHFFVAVLVIFMLSIWFSLLLFPSFLSFLL